ncbi:fasciclin domain-containing protein [Hoeflea alexandrii]|nr:fasciclin domain-containing protein [Hoeflea alexandrii]MCZ4288642.1 fasciclin domain-containing protein [Hoeflea alexandrii]
MGASSNYQDVSSGEGRVSFSPRRTMVNDAKVVTADIDTSNGVIYVIDKVPVPEGVL